MEKPTKEIVIELRVHLAEELYHEFFASKEEAVHLYLESSIPKSRSNIQNVALNEVKHEAKKLMTQSLSEAIEYLKNMLVTTSNEYDDLISLSSKFNRASEFLQKGLIDFQTAEQEFVRIGNAILQILKGLSSEHLRK
ncbi:MAG: hypothetical protein Q7T20_04590 [Saprospiraceae bacterium]|nr:hypothetical protein [Saprospiraceae bacterium]